jgi:hypothetical protein
MYFSCDSRAKAPVSFPSGAPADTARLHVKDAAARVGHGGVVDLAERPHDIEDLIANELDFIGYLLSKQTWAHWEGEI